MSSREITKNSQARMIRSWMLGLHATYITDIGGRLGTSPRCGGAAEQSQPKN